MRVPLSGAGDVVAGLPFGRVLFCCEQPVIKKLRLRVNKIESKNI
jgi:hypothetical protein